MPNREGDEIERERGDDTGRRERWGRRRWRSREAGCSTSVKLLSASLSLSRFRCRRRGDRFEVVHGRNAYICLMPPSLYSGQITRGSGEIKSASSRDRAGIRETHSSARSRFRAANKALSFSFRDCRKGGGRYWSQEVLHDPCYYLVIRSTRFSSRFPLSNAVEKVSWLPSRWCCCNV